MVDQLHVDAIVAQIPHTQVSSGARKRKTQAAVVLLATVVSLVTGVMGFVSAYQMPNRQNFVLGLLLCAFMLLLVRVLRWRRTFTTVVPYIPAQNVLEISDSFATRLFPRVRVSPMARGVATMLRRLDTVAWGLLVSALVLSAGAIFVLSAFGLFNALQNELRVIDLIMVIGMVRPFRSMVTGISKIRRQDAATRRHAQTFSKSFYYAVESFHLYVDKLSQSTVGMLQASSTAANKLSVGLATTASTVAVSVAVSGMGLASAQVAPQAVIATGEVIPLPPALVEFTGPEGREATIRGAVFYGCVGTLLDTTQPADQQCQTAVQQANDACVGWEGGTLPPECANALSGVLPQVMESIESTSPPVPPDTPPDIDEQSSVRDADAASSEQIKRGTQLPQRVNAAGTVIPQGTPTPCDRTRGNAQCPPAGAAGAALPGDSGLQTQRIPGQTNTLTPFDGTRGPRSLDGTPERQQPPQDGTPGRPPPPQDGTPGRPPRAEGTPEGPPSMDGTPGRPPRAEGTPDGPPPLDGTPGPLQPPEGTPDGPPPLDGTPGQPPRTEGPPGGPPPRATDVPPPRATDVPPPRATDVPPPRATDVPPPRATDVPPPRATDIPPPRATDVPKPTRQPPPRP